VDGQDLRLAARRTIAVRDPAATIDVVASKSHRTPETDTYIARYPVGDLVSRRLFSKFCLVAEGKADPLSHGHHDAVGHGGGRRGLRAARRLPVGRGRRAALWAERRGGRAAFRNPWFIAAGKVPIP
jgi:hypothetical protein